MRLVRSGHDMCIMEGSVSSDLRSCREPLCGEWAVTRGYCSSHYREVYAERHSGKGAQMRQSARWRKVRRNIFRRDGYMCQIRGLKCLTTASQVDHIVAVEDGGPMWLESNLQAVCGVCHGQKTNSEVRKRVW